MSDANTRRLTFDGFQAQDEKRREALLALGNGVLSWRACAVEAGKASDVHYPGLYHAGWYDNAPRTVNGTTVALEALVNLPDPFGLSISLDGKQWFDLSAAQLQRYRQSADFERGELTRQIEFQWADHAFSLVETRWVSMAQADLAVLRWSLDIAGEATSLWVRSTLDAGVRNALIERDRDYEGQRLQDIRLEHDASGNAWAHAALSDRTRSVTVACHTTLSSAQDAWQSHIKDYRLVQTSRCEVAAGETLHITKHVQVTVDGAVALPAPHDVARLQVAHREAWQQVWSHMPVHIESAALERALNFGAWHLVQTLSPLSSEHDLGFPARGWQEGYFGQIFWDEIFAFPFLCGHFPDAARTVLHYRYKRLEAARTLAKNAGFNGAMFPWRSGSSGTEQTPPFQFNPLSERWMPDHTYLQRHSGCAVAYDIWQLYLATGDQQLLAGPGGEMLVEIARFGASLTRFDNATERFWITDVLGPDEYHVSYPGAREPGLDNNAYTNLMVVWTLSRALQALELLDTEQAADLRLRTGLDAAEIEQWRQISQRMFVPFLGDRIISQFAGYEQLEHAPEGWFDGDQPRLDWLLESRHDHCDNYQLTKQADVLMLLHLLVPAELCALVQQLGYDFDLHACRRTADYYLQRITHESSLSKMVCAGALAHLDPDESWLHFLETLDTDLQAPSDSGTVEGIHLGAMAGALDVLHRHYLGLRPTVEGLRVLPAPPQGLGDASVRLLFRNAWLQASLTRGVLRIESEPGSPVVDLFHAGQCISLQPGQGVELAVAGGGER